MDLGRIVPLNRSREVLKGEKPATTGAVGFSFRFCGYAVGHWRALVGSREPFESSSHAMDPQR